ncbi:glycine betaine ABC transporter substrate-binding protein [Terriglobus sp.]|uniref:glycine betaine ABC transporter substrate-binding protein n=1 Tax=Terriglobus sp. TaxID=1889013 RepID=UPI003B003080
MKTAVRVLLAWLVTAMLFPLTACDPPKGSRIVIGAKNFTEQVLLGELLAQQIEAQGEKVERRFYLAGSYIAHQALLSGRIDAYVEYSGTALSSIFKQPVDRDRERVRHAITQLYAQQGVRVMAPLGFENTFAMVMRADNAARLHVSKLSDLQTAAPQLRLGVGYEFEERPDGLHGMEQQYHLQFAGAPRVMDLGLLYRAMANHQVDIVAGNSTDGAIPTMHLQVLVDDQHYFPPYEAVPVVREDTLRAHPAVDRALQQLAGKCSEAQMQAMNHAVEGDHRDPADVIRDFRREAGL